MRLMAVRLAVAVSTVAVLAAPAGAQDFQWKGRLDAGQTIEIKGVNGNITSTPSSSGDVEVTASKSARHSNPAEVRIEVVRGGDGVTICAVYPNARDREANRCAPGDGGHMSTNNNDTQVHFDVRLPAGVNLIANTVNGEIKAESLQGDVNAHTVNGSVRVSTAGSAEAATVNGSVTASMGRFDLRDGATFQTVNGDVTVNLPPGVDASVRADTLNGSVRSEFPITVQGTVSPRRLRGTIGNGGRELRLSTVNGSIRLLNTP
jgi:DUF4097 and DUF4098 domain-containing protein YvlB